MLNAFTVDVEDYFHPSEVQTSVPMSEWDRLPSRVVESTHQMLELLERRRVKATCFVLGWVAERFPGLVRDIHSAGHEIGCHSYAHQLVYDLTPEEFRADTLRALGQIEQACGVRPRLYRAPSYSVTRRSLWALDILAGCGFTHDSSIYPVQHDRYGIPGYPREAHRAQTAHGPLWEVPIATARLAGDRMLPVGGGGYLRLLPYLYTAAGIRRINLQDRMPACVYVHPWEIDEGQPRMAKGRLSRLRTYTGLRSMKAKLDRLLAEFPFAPIGELYPTQEGGPALT